MKRAARSPVCGGLETHFFSNFQTVTHLAAREHAHLWPSFLPDGDHFLFLGDDRIKVGSLRDGSSRDLMQGVTNAIFAEPDQILFVRSRALLAQKFNVQRLALEGQPHLIADQVAQNDSYHHYEFSASNGRLLYRVASSLRQLLWLDRTGKTIDKLGDPGPIGLLFRLSPDQQRIGHRALGSGWQSR